MVAMSLLLLCFEPATTAASMVICKAEDDRRRTRRAAAQRRMLLKRVSWLARGMGEAQGKKVASTALRLRRSRRSRSSARSSHHRGPVRHVLKRNLGRKVANLGSAVQEVGTVGRRERNRMREKAASLPRETFREEASFPRPYGTGLNRQPLEMHWKTTMFFRSSRENPAR